MGSKNLVSRTPPFKQLRNYQDGVFRRQKRRFLDGVRLQDLALRHIITRTSHTEAHRVSRVSHNRSWDHSFSGQNFVEVVWNLAVQLSACTYCRSTLLHVKRKSSNAQVKKWGLFGPTSTFMVAISGSNFAPLLQCIDG